MHWGFRLVFTSHYLVIPQRKRFRNRFHGLVNISLGTSSTPVVFIKQSAGVIRLVFGIHQPHSTDSTWNWFHNQFQRFRPPKEPVP
ncbi:hypothetical protein E2C01_050398 [Portunus trituberculatus]|uniref:Uncharacterized protein n=1 Tax=Portunus trituberculatus TaxID=210409 RepID=A0A5B7GGN8_PORTR|nr:hypothetical protein [Portunus trituberculatus]